MFSVFQMVMFFMGTFHGNSHYIIQFKYVLCIVYNICFNKVVKDMSTVILQSTQSGSLAGFTYFSFNEYLLITSYLPGTVLDARATVVGSFFLGGGGRQGEAGKKEKVFTFMGIYSSEEGQII